MTISNTPCVGAFHEKLLIENFLAHKSNNATVLHKIYKIRIFLY